MTYSPLETGTYLSTCDEGVPIVLRPQKFAMMGYLRHGELRPVYLPAVVKYLVPGSIEARGRLVWGAQVLIPEGLRGRLSTIPMDLVAPLDTEWASPCGVSSNGLHKTYGRTGENHTYCSQCGSTSKLEHIRVLPSFLEAPVLSQKGEVCTCALGDQRTKEALKVFEDRRYEAQCRRELWKKYVREGSEGHGQRHVVTWNPEPAQYEDEIWIDLAALACELADTPDDPICSTWIAGENTPPPSYAWQNLMHELLNRVCEIWTHHSAVVLDARKLIAALIERPPWSGRFGSEEKDFDTQEPGELLRRLRNRHERLREEGKPRMGVLVALPPADTWGRDIEGRSGLASGRALWLSGR